jgi:hypothetical protein
LKSAIALAVALGACGSAGDEPQPPPTPPARVAVQARAPARPRPQALAHVTIKALGMYCEESCPLAVRRALRDVPAVYELGFDLPNESIFVSYDASLGAAKQVTEPMLEAVRRAGFEPWLAKETWPDGATAEVVGR